MSSVSIDTVDSERGCIGRKVLALDLGTKTGWATMDGHGLRSGLGGEVMPRPQTHGVLMNMIDEIKDRWAKATPGPWGWFGNTKVHEIYLATIDRGRQFVMQFVRWGMRGAQPRFQVGGLMHPATDFVKYEVAPVVGVQHRNHPDLYRQDFVGLDHPDAEAITHAPEDIAFLLAEVEQLKRESDALHKQLSMACTEPDDHCTCDGCRYAAEVAYGQEFVEVKQ